jgi:hypothetical protein
MRAVQRPISERNSPSESSSFCLGVSKASRFTHSEPDSARPSRGQVVRLCWPQDGARRSVAKEA